MFLFSLLLLLTFCVVAAGLWCGLYTLVMAHLCYHTPPSYDDEDNKEKDLSGRRQHLQYTKWYLQVAAWCGLLTGFLMSPLEVLAHSYRGTVPCAFYGLLHEGITSVMAAGGAGILLLSVLDHFQKLDSPYWRWVLRYVPGCAGVLALVAQSAVCGSQKLYMGELVLQGNHSTPETCTIETDSEAMMDKPHWLRISTMINAVGLLVVAVTQALIEIPIWKRSKYFANDDDVKVKAVGNPSEDNLSSKRSTLMEIRNATPMANIPVHQVSEAKRTSIVSASMASSKSDMSEARATHLLPGFRCHYEPNHKRASQITLPGAIAQHPDLNQPSSVCSRGGMHRLSLEALPLSAISPHTAVTVVSSTLGNKSFRSSSLSPVDKPRELPLIRTADILAQSPLVQRRLPEDKRLTLDVTRELPIITSGMAENLTVKVDVTTELPLIFYDKIQNWCTQPFEQQQSLTQPTIPTGLDTNLSASPVSCGHSPVSVPSVSPPSGSFLRPFQASPSSRKKLTWSSARQVIVEADDDNLSASLEPVAASECCTTPTEAMSVCNSAVDIADMRALTPLPPRSQICDAVIPDAVAIHGSAARATVSPEQQLRARRQHSPIVQDVSPADGANPKPHREGGITKPRCRLLVLGTHLVLVLLSGVRLVWETPIMLCQSECWFIILILPLQRLCLAVLPALYLDISPILGGTEHIE